MSTNLKKIIGYISLFVAIGIVMWIAFQYSSKKNEMLVFSEHTMLKNIWLKYKANYLEPGTLRTLDKQQEFISTSEGESYTMLRAVWMDDKATFDTSLKWTTDNTGTGSRREKSEGI